MKFLWHLKLYEMARGFRVEIAGGGNTVTGEGPTVEAAFRQADVQLVRKPPFVPFTNTPARADAEAVAVVPDLKGSHALVLYFPTDADCDEFVALINEAKPGMRTVKL